MFPRFIIFQRDKGIITSFHIYIPRPEKGEQGRGSGFEHFEFIFLRSIYLSHALSLLIKLFRSDAVVMVAPR